MNKDIIYFAENVCGFKLPKWQKEMLLQSYEVYKKGGSFIINVSRHQGKQLLQNILINYELWLKDHRITELEEQLKNKQEELDFSININRNKKRLYSIWRKINQRCFDKTCEAYSNYGGRGITICKEWQNLGGFYSFVIWALNNGYNPELTIDRINNNGNYEPYNCRWATKLEQANNKRKNRFLTAFGETDTMSNMARKYDVNVDCLWSRLNAGWNVEKALSTTVRKGNYRKAKLEELKGE